MRVTNFLKRHLFSIAVGLAAVGGIAVGAVAARQFDGDRIEGFGLDARVQHIEPGYGVDFGVPGQRVPRPRAVLGVQLDGGLKVTSVLPGSPAQRAGVEVGDQLTDVNGRAVNTTGDVRSALDGVAPDTDFAVRVSRGGKAVDLTAHSASDGRGGRFGFRGWFGPMPGMPGVPPAPALPFPRRDRIDGPRLGVAVEAATGGMRITAVGPRSAAETAGVRVGDVVTAANGKPAATVEALRAVVAEAGFGGAVTLSVTRDGAATTLTVRLGERPAPSPARGPRA